VQLIFITNDPTRAAGADAAGIDQVMVDLEINGKVARQGHRDTVISRHTPDDISSVRRALRRSNLLVRVNPIFEGSAGEIDDALARGADRLMLPMFTTPDEVQRFVDLAKGRAELTLLLETTGALARLPDILDVRGIGCVHVGLNDLHLGMQVGFMFELLSGGIVEHIGRLARARGIRFGFGGVGRLEGSGALSPRLILSEHVRLGSEQVILSRDFARVFEDANPAEAAAQLAGEVGKLRAHVAAMLAASGATLAENALAVREAVAAIRSSQRA
jgi:2-keto-3-deoxy-L-rhamnonate aldolase RhmA